MIRQPSFSSSPERRCNFFRPSLLFRENPEDETGKNDMQFPWISDENSTTIERRLTPPRFALRFDGYSASREGDSVIPDAGSRSTPCDTIFWLTRTTLSV